MENQNSNPKRFQLATTLILLFLLAFLVFFFIKKANAQTQTNELQINVVGKANLNGYIQVRPGERIRMQAVLLEHTYAGRTLTNYLSPSGLFWWVDGQEITLGYTTNDTYYEVPYDNGWDYITIDFANPNFNGLYGTIYLQNIAYNGSVGAPGDYQADTYDYNYYDDIPEYIDTDSIITTYMTPVMIDGHRFYRFAGVPADYSPFSCGRFIMTSFGLRYIPCRDYPWEWLIAYRGCMRHSREYGWLWYYDPGIVYTGVRLSINLFFTPDWAVFYPYNPYYSAIYQMGYDRGFDDGFWLGINLSFGNHHSGHITVHKDRFLYNRVRDHIVRNADAGIIERAHRDRTRGPVRDFLRQTVENSSGRRYAEVHGPKDDGIFREKPFRGRLRDTFTANRPERGRPVAGSDDRRVAQGGRREIPSGIRNPGTPGRLGQDRDNRGGVSRPVPTVPGRTGDDRRVRPEAPERGGTPVDNRNQGRPVIPGRRNDTGQTVRPEAPERGGNNNAGDRTPVTPVRPNPSEGRVKPGAPAGNNAPIRAPRTERPTAPVRDVRNGTPERPRGEVRQPTPARPQRPQGEVRQEAPARPAPVRNVGERREAPKREIAPTPTREEPRHEAPKREIRSESRREESKREIQQRDPAPQSRRDNQSPSKQGGNNAGKQQSDRSSKSGKRR